MGRVLAAVGEQRSLRSVCARLCVCACVCECANHTTVESFLVHTRPCMGAVPLCGGNSEIHPQDFTVDILQFVYEGHRITDNKLSLPQSDAML
jgi:hypothetical protein